MPETFAGVGDLPVGAYMTLGYELPGDNMAAVYKSKCCLIWACKPGGDPHSRRAFLLGGEVQRH